MLAGVALAASSAVAAEAISPNATGDGESRQLVVRVPDLSLRAGATVDLKLVVENHADEALTGKLYWRVESPDGKVATQGHRQPWRLEAHDTLSLSIALKAPMPGKYTVVCTAKGRTTQTDRAAFAVANARGPSSLNPLLRLRLLEGIDCAGEQSPGFYRDDGQAKVVPSPLGAYREAGETLGSRFAYRFEVDRLRIPHLLVVQYPDDRARRMVVSIDSPSYPVPGDVASGMACGGPFPVTNRVYEHRLLFWPREAEGRVMIVTAGPGMPAAALSVKVYEVEGGLPGLQVNEPSGQPSRRLGLEWARSSILPSFGGRVLDDPAEVQIAVANLVDYLRWTGQNVVSFPVGPEDEGWMSVARRMFDAEGVAFVPARRGADAAPLAPGTVVLQAEVFTVATQETSADLWWPDLFSWSAPIMPAHKHFAGFYAVAMADRDPEAIFLAGAANPALGHDYELQRFAQAYRALPAREFTATADATDPVVVRYSATADGFYGYLVNKDRYPVGVEVTWEGPVEVTDPATRLRLPTAGRSMTLSLSPYELRAFAAGSTARIESVKVILPKEVSDALPARPATLAPPPANATPTEGDANGPNAGELPPP
jgi:hypothetical protein